MLVDEQKLDAVVKLPAGVFRPYATVSTAILFFTRTDSGGTDDVWFYDVLSDGYSLDDKRTPLESSDLVDVLRRWPGRSSDERDRTRVDQSFLVAKDEIVRWNYDLAIGRYREVQQQAVEHRSLDAILADVEALEDEIVDGLAELKALLT